MLNVLSTLRMTRHNRTMNDKESMRLILLGMFSFAFLRVSSFLPILHSRAGAVRVAPLRSMFKDNRSRVSFEESIDPIGITNFQNFRAGSIRRPENIRERSSHHNWTVGGAVSIFVCSLLLNTTPVEAKTLSSQSSQKKSSSVVSSRSTRPSRQPNQTSSSQGNASNYSGSSGVNSSTVSKKVQLDSRSSRAKSSKPPRKQETTVLSKKINESSRQQTPRTRMQSTRNGPLQSNEHGAHSSTKRDGSKERNYNSKPAFPSSESKDSAKVSSASLNKAHLKSSQAKSFQDGTGDKVRKPQPNRSGSYVKVASYSSTKPNSSHISAERSSVGTRVSTQSSISGVSNSFGEKSTHLPSKKVQAVSDVDDTMSQKRKSPKDDKIVFKHQNDSAVQSKRSGITDGLVDSSKTNGNASAKIKSPTKGSEFESKTLKKKSRSANSKRARDQEARDLSLLSSKRNIKVRDRDLVYGDSISPRNRRQKTLNRKGDKGFDTSRAGIDRRYYYVVGSSSPYYRKTFSPQQYGATNYYNDYAPALPPNQSYPPYRRLVTTNEALPDSQFPKSACFIELFTEKDPIDVLVDPTRGFYVQGLVEVVDKQNCNFIASYTSPDTGNVITKTFYTLPILGNVGID